MHNTVQVLLRLEPDVASKLKILAYLHNTSKGAFLTTFILKAWDYEPMTDDPRVNKLIGREIRKNPKSFIKRELEI